MNNPPPFDPRLFRALAQQLVAQQPPEEVRYRTAVGRAYYALFLVARDNLRIMSTKEVHTEVIKMLRAQNQAWANQLDMLRHFRTVADYELVPADPTKRDWQTNWDQVHRIATRLAPVLDGVRPAPGRGLGT